MIKPYVPLIDPILEVILSVGDFLLLAISLPLYPLTSWWRGRKSEKAKPTSRPDSRSKGFRPADVDRNRARNSAYDASKAPRPPTETRARTSQKAHEIWQPPPSSYDDDGPPAYAASSGPPPPMPVPQPYIPPPHTQTDQSSLDWRAYPPFPSAYPPTPLPPKAPVPNSFRSERPQIYAVPENGNGHGRINGNGTTGHNRPPEGYDMSSEQDFHMSLEPAREPSNPGSDGSSSDDMDMQGVQPTYDASTATSTISEGNDDEDDNDEDYVDEEEDSFDITLRTPRPVRFTGKNTTPRSRTVYSLATPSGTLDESMMLSPQSSSPATDTQRTPPRNRIASGTTSVSMDVSDSPSLAGRKRVRTVRSPTKAVRSPRKPTSKIARPAFSHTTSTRVHRGKISAKSASILAGLDEEMDSETEEEEEEEQTLEDISEDSVDSSSAVISKRRKVIRAPSLVQGSTPRKRASPAKRSTKERTNRDPQRPSVAPTRTSSLRAARARSVLESSRMTTVKAKTSTSASRSTSRDTSSMLLDKPARTAQSSRPTTTRS